MTTKAWQEKWPVKVAASLTVHEIPNMTAKGRKAVCGWLRKLADDLQNEPEAFAKTFRARYMYPANATAHVRAVASNVQQIVGNSGPEDQ